MPSPPVQDCLSDLGAQPSTAPIEQRLAALQASWKQEAKVLGRLATAVSPLTRPGAFSDLTKARTNLAKVRTKVQGLEGAGDRTSAFLEQAEQAIARRHEELRKRFAQDLQAACDAARLEILVRRREDPLELRIPPFAVVVDRVKGCAEIRFARLPIATAAADPQAILDAHRKVWKELSRGFDAPAFFDACFAAWTCARADATHGPSRSRAGGGERIEIQDFLPHLALQLQPRPFRIEPSAKNFRPYSRAHFAFDLMQLRQAGMLSRNNLRLNLGVASGTTASKKNRALFVENEMGEGEYKLTVYFTRMES